MSIRKSVYLLLTIPASFCLTMLGYVLLSNLVPEFSFVKHRLTHPYFVPRITGGISNIPTDVFTNFMLLLIIILYIALSIYFLLVGIRKLKSYLLYLVVIYLYSITLVFAFLMLTGEELEHLRYQTDNSTNGVWYQIDKDLSKLPEFGDVNSYDRLKYLYTSGLFDNTAGYTKIGTTHPPGQMMIAYLIYDVSRIFSSPIIAWACIITLLNLLIIIIFGFCLYFIYGNSLTTRLTVLVVCFTPTVSIHFCALFEIISSLFSALGLLPIIYLVKNIDKTKPPVAYLLLLTASLFFVLQAQIAYGHAIPILAYSISLLMVLYKKDDLRFNVFAVISYLFLPCSFLAMEYFLSDGHSVWPIRALMMADLVGREIEKLGRPLLASKLGNFTIISTMFGIFHLPAFALAINITCKKIKKSLGFVEKNESNFCDPVVIFLSTAITIMLAAIIFQNATRLEVERTWHWLSLPTWLLIGEFFHMAKKVFEHLRLTGKDVFRITWGMLITQVAISLVYALVFQDYY